MYSHILIATDGSALAQKGIDHGLALAAKLGSKVTVITVSEPLSRLANADFSAAVLEADIANLRRRAEEAATNILTKAKTAAEQSGVKAETLYVPEMRPAEAIVRAANDLHCDLIVMASHGRRGLGRLFLGSQTIEALTHSTVPVLVVR